ncbi:MAG: UDP-N-acetylglucosamine 1-carboxyvinyltransferase [Holosporaceae bacterium]|jgi:UDP-N-acetylglucosamine 1-carboxyvinyltransferase|nr:UDP-N-acetylglucosamine 1-carboxyvinyltransferase [Holosporaceae bacterium]
MGTGGLCVSAINSKAAGTVHRLDTAGAKNSALPTLIAAVLNGGRADLYGVPHVSDVENLLKLLERLGATASRQMRADGMLNLSITADRIDTTKLTNDLMKTTRGSVLVLGPLLARKRKCCIAKPGGCSIGKRPIDLHLAALASMGAKITELGEEIYADAPSGLHGADIDFPIKTVTGTENLMMAATLANGKTILKNAALEPEITDLGNFLNQMGARITGHGTDIITIEGVTNLSGTEYTIMTDRIEAGSYMIAAAVSGNIVDVMGGDFRSLLPGFIPKMEGAGVEFEDLDNGLRVKGPDRFRAVEIDTAPHPGFPTDLQPQMMAMLCLADGESIIRENIWENRFMHVAELNRMGANITIDGPVARIRPVKQLYGTTVTATDLRAAFALIVAAIAARGETIIKGVHHLDRGYSCVKEKLAACGLNIERIM